MDIYTAVHLNHIFGSVYVLILPVLGIVIILCGIFTRVESKKKMLIAAGVLSFVIFGIDLYGCMGTYAVGDQYLAKHETQVTNGVTAEVSDRYTVRVTNTGDEPVMLKERHRYKIECYIEGGWYNITSSDHDELSAEWWYLSHVPEQELQPGECVDIDYRIDMYGELRPGHYRYVIEQDLGYCCFAVFDITENGEFIWPE